MALHHRRFLLPDPKQGPDKKHEDDKPKKNDSDCHLDHCNQQHHSSPPQSPSQPHDHFPYLILTVCFVAAATVLLFLAYCAIRRRRRSRRYSTNTPPSDGLLIDNELQQSPGNVIDHHVWHIRTIGLSEAAIDSIAVFNYKKRDGLIEGTSDCAVCLSEFLEDESLRLLPKCSHAFHVACIDTWLRCHKNCPVCRAPVVSGDRHGGSEGDLVGSGSSGVRSGEENRVESEVGTGETENHRASRVEEDKLAEILSIWGNSSVRNGKFRVVSDLGDHHDRVNVSRELRGQVRRAVSMDLSRSR